MCYSIIFIGPKAGKPFVEVQRHSGELVVSL